MQPIINMNACIDASSTEASTSSEIQNLTLWGQNEIIFLAPIGQKKMERKKVYTADPSKKYFC